MKIPWLYIDNSVYVADINYYSDNWYFNRSTYNIRMAIRSAYQDYKKLK